MVRRLRVLLPLCLPLCAALCLASCGQPAAGPSPTSSGAGPEPTASGPTSGAAAVFPVTLVRRGGIAGFHDRMRVDADGTVTFSRHGAPPQRCRLERPLLRRIEHAARQAQWPRRSQPPTTPRYADELVVVVRSARGAAQLDATTVRELQGPLTRLLADVSRPAGHQELCTPLE